METFLLNLLDGAGKIDFQLVWKVLAFVFAIFWVVVLDWVWLDAGERTSKRSSRVIYLLVVLFLNVFGWIIYLIIRPSQTIEQIYWADLERRYLKYETSELDDCVTCGTQLYPGYTYCPSCGLEIKTKCKSCGVYIEKNSQYCPYCGVVAEKEVAIEEEVPSREVMEQQIQASKDEASKVVEGEQTRYSTVKRSLTVKIGSSIIVGLSTVFDKIKAIISPVKSKITALPVRVFVKKNKKKKKNKKH